MKEKRQQLQAIIYLYKKPYPRYSDVLFEIHQIPKNKKENNLPMKMLAFLMTLSQVRLNELQILIDFEEIYF